MSWEHHGGPGTVEYFPLGMAIVVRQSADAHRRIGALLEGLRRWRDRMQGK